MCVTWAVACCALLDVPIGGTVPLLRPGARHDSLMTVSCHSLVFN